MLGTRAWQKREGAQHICFQFLLYLPLLLVRLGHLQAEVQEGEVLVLLHLLLAEVEVEELLQVLLQLLLPEVEVEVKGEVAEQLGPEHQSTTH